MTQTCSCGGTSFVCRIALYNIMFRREFLTIFPSICEQCGKSVTIKADFYIEKELSHEQTKQQ